MSFFDDAISSIGQGLATTAVQSLSESTGIDVGGALGFLFGGQTTGGANLDALGGIINGAFGTGGKDANPGALDQLTATVGQQTAAIAELGSQLTGISTELGNIQDEVHGMQELLASIAQQQLFSSWSTVDTSVKGSISAITSCYTQYSLYIANYSTTPTAEVSGLITDILDPNVGPLDSLTAIHGMIMAGGQGKGALQLWSEMVSPLIQQSAMDYRLGVQQYFQYYQKLAYAQLQAVNLLMEAYIYNGDKTNANAMWSNYKANLLAQEDTFINWLVPLIYSGVAGGMSQSGRTEFTNFSFTEAATQLNPQIQCVIGDADPGNGFYEPSSIFQKAETLLANLYVTEPTDRRIVVHMLYPNSSNISSLLSGLDLTLSGLSTGAAGTVNSVSGNILGAPFAFPAAGQFSPDKNAYTGIGFYLKRYVFDDSQASGLTDGSYSVTDLRGHNGLLPMYTYESQSTPFQQKAVLSYNLEISSVSKFDFMNFAGYSEPQLTVLW